MLDNIKSTYFAKIIFSYINDKLKLILVKKSKKLQKQIDINILNYKIFYGKYIIPETDKIIKEYLYYNDKLIYIGEYLNNKRNGFGSEYDSINGNLIFEGEYLNNKRHGKGKEYYHNGIASFEGEYLNNKKWNGIGYDRNNNIIYELNEGKGYVKEYYDLLNKIKYEGEYLNGERNGKGKEYDYNGDLIFEGEYLNNKKWKGVGYDSKKNIIYEIKSGKGFVKELYNYSDNLIYKGFYLNGEKNGKCEIYYKDVIIFEGEYINQRRNGKGKEYDYDGNLIFEGEYLYDYKKKGKEFIQNKIEFDGEYFFNKKWNGKGYDENGNTIYELKNGNGHGREYYYNGNLKYEGEYLNGKRNGNGKEYFYNGNLRFEGIYLNGEIFKGNLINNFY